MHDDPSTIPERYKSVYVPPAGPTPVRFGEREVDKAPVVTNEQSLRALFEAKARRPPPPPIPEITKRMRVPVHEIINDPKQYRIIVEALAKRGFMIVPIEPTQEMIAASMETVQGGRYKMTKREKHKRRLQAALTAHRLKSAPETL